VRAWLGLALCLALPAGATEVRGMTVSCPTWGWEWGTDEMASTLTVLDTLGVNWVSIHPYARIGADGTVRFEPIDPQSPPAWLERPVREAHARGQKVLVKPHLAYWGSPFSWRGDIRFDDPADQARFFASYTAWVTQLAAATADADAFAVGTELDGTTAHEAQWRSVIGSVRGVFDGHLTYAANWDAFDEVPFWDAVDAIGVQAYFPLVEPGQDPTPAALDAGWDRWLVRLKAVHDEHGKAVVFTELGYDSAVTAATEPWKPGRGAGDPALQEAALDAALRAIDREPAVVGAFLWKWFPGEVPRGDFRLSEPRLRERIAARWAPPRSSGVSP
jgi:hypothetical protein